MFNSNLALLVLSLCFALELSAAGTTRCRSNESGFTLTPDDDSFGLTGCMINNITGLTPPCQPLGETTYSCTRADFRLFMWSEISFSVNNVCYYGCVRIPFSWGASGFSGKDSQHMRGQDLK